jgi:hypothetical protein
MLNAIVASTAVLRARVAEYRDMYVVDLAQGLGLLPVSDELRDRVSIVDGDRMGLWLLPDGFGDVLAVWSRSGPVAYLEADYFGGTGEQRAAVWDAGRLAFGPVHIGVNEPFLPEGSPISQALRYLGAQHSERGNEFDAVGLLRHRYTEDWAEEAAAAGRNQPRTCACRTTRPPTATKPTPCQGSLARRNGPATSRRFSKRAGNRTTQPGSFLIRRRHRGP